MLASTIYFGISDKNKSGIIENMKDVIEDKDSIILDLQDSLEKINQIANSKKDTLMIKSTL